MTTKDVPKEINSELPSADTPKDEKQQWDEALAATTPDQWKLLEQMFREDESKGLMPLNFPAK